MGLFNRVVIIIYLLVAAFAYIIFLGAVRSNTNKFRSFFGPGYWNFVLHQQYRKVFLMIDDFSILYLSQKY